MKENKTSSYLQKALESSNLSEKKNKPGYYENKDTGREIKLSNGKNYYQEESKGGHIPVGRKTTL